MLIVLLLFIGVALTCLNRYSLYFGFLAAVYYIFLGITFAVYLLRHIVVRRQRICAFTSACLMVFLLIIRIMKYKFCIEASDISRYLWYSFYVPFFGIPLFLFYTSLFLGDKRPKYLTHIMIAGGVVSLFLIGMVLTNDLHQLVFRFDSLSDWNNYEYKFIYYIIFIWIFFLFFSAYAILIRNCGVLMGKKYSWLVIVYGSIGWGLVAVLNFTGIQDVIFDNCHPINFAELYCAQSMSFILTCIRLWLIPADKDYNRLNEAIEEVNEQLEEESELIRLQNELKKEQFETEQKNQLYDEIAQNVSHESKQVLKLTEQSDNLSVVCVYGAYIKRIANVMLMSSEKEYIPMGELILSIREIAKYLDKTKVYISLYGSSEGEISAVDAIDILRVLDHIVCENLSGLLGISVTFADNRSSFLRVAVEGTAHINIASNIGNEVVCSAVTEDDITYLTFGFVNGGDVV